MKASDKVAIVRIFSDMIKADRIIYTVEMDCWQHICAKYSINKEVEIEAQNISFAAAMDAIC